MGPSRSQGHGRPWFSLCYLPELQQYILKLNETDPFGVGFLLLLLSELEAVLQSCSLVEYEVVSCRVRILEEVTYSLELNRDA